MGITRILFRRIESLPTLLIGALLLLVLSPVSGIASTIIPSDADIQMFDAPTSGVDVLRISPPNSSGISINHFSQFVVDGRKLNLVNVAGLIEATDGSGEVAIKPASVIVIIADNIDIRDTVELQGSASDVIFISTSSTGSITCEYCNFSNVLRLSLVTATPVAALAEDVSEIGDLTPAATTSISISNLTAPGSIGVDVLTSQLTLDGVVELHQRVVKDTNGGYRNDLNGNLVLGTGEFGVLLGAITWNYDSSQIIAVESTGAVNTLGGSVKSAGVKISAATELVLNTVIDTRTDLLSSVNYKDGVYIPVERIDIQTFADQPLVVLGNQTSNAEVQIKSTEDLSFGEVKIDAPILEVIAKGTFRNFGVFEGGYISVAGDSVINEGDLIAAVNIDVWSHKDFANQYGGLVKAASVKLVSETSVVRNGSRTPYESRGFEAEGLLSLSLISEGGNAGELGTFYSLGFDVDTASLELVLPQDSSAHIVADRIEVSAAGFENINPYYVKVNNQDEVVLRRKYIDQVSVVAESYIGISTTTGYYINTYFVKLAGYVINSSALLMVNSPNGVLDVDTGVSINERYRVLSVLSKVDGATSFDSNPTVIEEYSSTTVASKTYSYPTPITPGEEVFTSIGSRTVSYSPPGRIVSMGDVNIAAHQRFLNKAAYLEVFGDAVFDTPVINDYGLANQGIINSSTNYYYETGYLVSTDTDNVVADPQEFDSLFFVHGNLEANAADNWYGNYNSFDEFIIQATNNIIEENYGWVGSGNSFTTSMLVIDSEVSGGSTLEAKQTGTIKIGWRETAVMVACGLFGSCYEQHNTGTDTYSLVDELVKMYDEIKNTVVDFFEELDWWNE